MPTGSSGQGRPGQCVVRLTPDSAWSTIRSACLGRWRRVCVKVEEGDRDQAPAVVAMAQGRTLRRHAHLRLRRRDALARARSETRRLSWRDVAGALRREGRSPAPAPAPARRGRAGALLYPRLGGRAPPGRGVRRPRRRSRDRAPRLPSRLGGSVEAGRRARRLRAGDEGAPERARRDAAGLPRARLGAHAHHARLDPQARDVPLLEPEGRRLPVPPPRRAAGRGIARAVGPRRRALLPDAPAPGATAHAEPRGDLRHLARRVPRLLRVGRPLQPHVSSASDRPPVAAPHAAPADPLRQAPPWRLVGHRQRGGGALARAAREALNAARGAPRATVPALSLPSARGWPSPSRGASRATVSAAARPCRGARRAARGWRPGRRSPRWS